MARQVSKQSIAEMRAVVGSGPTEMDLIRALHLSRNDVSSAINILFDTPPSLFKPAQRPPSTPKANAGPSTHVHPQELRPNIPPRPNLPSANHTIPQQARPTATPTAPHIYPAPLVSRPPSINHDPNSHPINRTPNVHPVHYNANLGPVKTSRNPHPSNHIPVSTNPNLHHGDYPQAVNNNPNRQPVNNNISPRHVNAKPNLTSEVDCISIDTSESSSQSPRQKTSLGVAVEMPEVLSIASPHIPSKLLGTVPASTPSMQTKVWCLYFIHFNSTLK